MATIRTMLLTILAFISILPPAVTQAASDHQEIIALYQGWIKAVEGSNVDSYVNGLHPDVSLRPPGVAGVDGRANYRAFLGPVFSTARYEITVDVPHSINMLGDAAIVEYDYTIRRIIDASADADLPDGALEEETTTAHYIDVVTRDGTGAWKIRLHSWSTTL